MGSSTFSAGVCAVLLVMYVCCCQAQDCVPLRDEPCKCRMSDGRGLDLTNIATVAQFEKFQGVDGFSYGWSPCSGSLNHGGECKSSEEPAGCQGSTDPSSWLSIGTLRSVVYYFNNTNHPSVATALYSGGTEGRSMSVQLVCTQQSPGDIIELNEQPEKHYNFQLISAEACLRDHIAAASEGSSGSLSAGSILLIVFFVGVLLYFVVGFLFMSSVREAQGTDRIPNKELWTSLPFLIKDGALFVISPCRSSGSKSSDYQNI